MTKMTRLEDAQANWHHVDEDANFAQHHCPGDFRTTYPGIYNSRVPCPNTLLVGDEDRNKQLCAACWNKKVGGRE